MYSASLASRIEKIWWMARGMTPAELVRSVPSLVFLGPPCSSDDLAGFQCPDGVATAPLGRGWPFACLHTHLSGMCSRIPE